MSFAGSPFATLPPIVPRFLTCGSAIWSEASLITGADLNNFSLVQKQIDSIKKERKRLLKELAKIKAIKAYPSDSNFILFQATKNGEKVFRKLMENGILVRNLGSHPMLKNCLRVTIGTKAENDQFLDQLKKAI